MCLTMHGLRQRHLAPALDEDALGQLLDPGGNLDESIVALRGLALLLFELRERVEVAKKLVGGLSERVMRVDGAIPSAPSCRPTLAPVLRRGAAADEADRGHAGADRGHRRARATRRRPAGMK
jgi:hypothetical protein